MAVLCAPFYATSDYYEGFYGSTHCFSILSLRLCFKPLFHRFTPFYVCLHKGERKVTVRLGEQLLVSSRDLLYQSRKRRPEVSLARSALLHVKRKLGCTRTRLQRNATLTTHIHTYSPTHTPTLLLSLSQTHTLAHTHTAHINGVHASFTVKQSLSNDHRAQVETENYLNILSFWSK